MNDGWEMPDGTQVSLNTLPKGDLVLRHSLEGIDTGNMRLCTTSTDTHITVKFEKEQVYRYAPELSDLLGESYGMYIHMVVIPPGAKEVTLYLHPIYEFNPVSIGDLTIEDAGMFMGDLYHQRLPGFVICLLIALFGALMLIIGFVDYGAGNKNSRRFFSLGTFAILIGIWSANDTLVLQIYTQRPELIRFLIYQCIIFIPYPPVSFIATVTNRKDTLLRRVLLFLVLVNFLVIMVLSLLGQSDIRRLLPFSHANVVIAICILVYFLVSAARRKEIERQMQNKILIGMGTAIFGVALDMIRFQLNPGGMFSSSFFTRIGVLFFLLMMGWNLLRERSCHEIERSQAQLAKKMAYTDGLTELANRAAFHEKEKQIVTEGRECYIVQLDINLLKKVNDVYGHAEGDRHIVNAAHAIRDSFSGLGTAYRTGGDEFIVVAQDVGTDSVEQALRQLEHHLEAYNEQEKPPVPLQIAYGYAKCQPTVGRLKEAEVMADRRMYEKKKAMKENDAEKENRIAGSVT